MILFTCIGCAQTTINLREYGYKVANEIAFPNVTSIVDDDNSLNHYVGTWQTVDQNQNTITLYITKLTAIWLEGTTIERLEIKYTMVDTAGNLLFDSRNLPSGYYCSFEGKYINSNGKYIGSWGYEESFASLCGTNGLFELSLTRSLNGPSYLEFGYFETSSAHEMSIPGECLNGSEYPLLPISQDLQFNRI